ncbi:MAG TPA: iron-sulfur cluster assembly scaffold protein [Candidatus Limnocylindrales bacterium]|nr:iron-sulfur cluster assembly scaffold protein [Candidatus Limnocylindrales bacterium]
MYSPKLLDHFQNPRNVGELPPPAITVQVANPACGDEMRLSVLFAAGKVRDARYKVRGCTASIAAGSATAEWLIDRTRDELAALRPADIELLVDGLAAESKHAAVICADAVKEILRSFNSPTGVPPGQ